MDSILKMLPQFDSIGLQQMDAVLLLNRYDLKYQVTEEVLFEVLNSIHHDYFILEINGELYQKYRTTYYDTDDNRLYLAHHNGKLNRLKIRKREYVNSGIAFLELKQKNNKGKTHKLRMPLKNWNDRFSLGELEFLKRNTSFSLHHCAMRMKPKNVNTFRRITLVNKAFTERCTIDLQLTFHSNDRKFRFKNMAVVELKQGKMNMHTPLYMALKEHRVKPGGFSKYCLGRAILEPDLKQNRFKTKLLGLKKHHDGFIEEERTHVVHHLKL